MAETAVRTAAPAAKSKGAGKSGKSAKSVSALKSRLPGAKPDAMLQMGPPVMKLGPGESMPSSVQEELERSFKMDVGSVRLHTGAAAQEAAKGLSARAFTYG